MKTRQSQQQLFELSEGMPLNTDILIINKERFLEFLGEALSQESLDALRIRVREIKNIIASPRSDLKGILNIDKNGDTISLRGDVFLSELDQVLEALTLKRARYYLKRLETGISKTKTTKLNDINLSRWKEYDEVITDSLWIMHKRDNSGAHLAEYWGNFIPQIPHQMMLRYSKKHEWVLDTFAGSGTTLIEGKRLGRNCIGIELNPDVAKRAKQLIAREHNKFDVTAHMEVADSRTLDIKTTLAKHGISRVQLLIMHPPYHDIIKFSTDQRDLSNAKTTQDFLTMFGETVDNATPFLDKGRYLALVIGDKYSKGEWIPLGFLCMSEVLKREYRLKAIIVKNFEQTRSKRNQQELWRYRALVGGFYVFKHEYVMVFKKE